MINLTEEQKQFLIQSAIRFDKACTIAKDYCTKINDRGIPCVDCLEKEIRILEQAQDRADQQD